MHSISGSDDHQHLNCGADRMELEAAEALAGLAQVAATRESSESGTAKWGSKGKRARSSGQVKSESPHVDSPDLALNSSDYQGTMEYDQVEETDTHEGFKKAKIKQQAKLLSPTLTGEASTTAAFGGSRSRKNLTEAEKEEKRLRRVLANRESARQTIRRRQALHEELSRKASDLTVENVDLKREKELALEKLRSLKNTNELLKTRMCQSVNPVREENFLQGVQNVKPQVEDNLLKMALNIKSEVDENLDLKLAHPNVSSSRNTSNVHCNDTSMEHSQFVRCGFPPIIQSLDSDQSAPMRCIPMFAPGLNSSYKKPYTVNSPLTPVYILPYPWFVPVPCHRDDEANRDSSAVENGKYNTVNGSASSDTGMIENPNSTLTLQAKAEVSDAKENGAGTSSYGTQFLHMIDGHGAGVFGGHAIGTVRTLSPSTSSDPSHVSTGKDEPWFLHDSSQQGSRSHCLVPQMNRESAFFFPTKITDHAVAAAEARKRRKELTKFKNFTGRQYRLPC